MSEMSELLTGYRLTDFDDLSPAEQDESPPAWGDSDDLGDDFADDAARQVPMFIDIDLTFLQTGGEMPSIEVPRFHADRWI